MLIGAVGAGARMEETRPFLAAASVMAAMAIIGFVDNFVPILAETHGLWQFHLFRAAMVLPAIWLLACFGFGRMRPVSWRAVILRSFVISLSMVLYFGALAFLPIAEVAAGLFTAPIWVLLISVLFLGRRVGPIRTGAALVGFVGVLLVIKPDTGTPSPLALVPLLAGALYAVSATLTRELCARESALSLLSGNFVALGIWGGLALALLALLGTAAPEGADGFVLRGWAAPDPRFLGLVAVQGGGALVGVWLLIRGYQLAETSFVAVFEFSFLVFASSWAWVLRGEGLDPWGAAGIALIIVSGATIALRGR